MSSMVKSLFLEVHFMNLFALLESINPENIIVYGGLGLLLLIIFAETGVFFGFFLPGDSLLFVAGLMCDDPKYLDMNVTLLIILLIIAAVSGSTVGYLTGRWAGGYLANKKDSL